MFKMAERLKSQDSTVKNEQLLKETISKEIIVELKCFWHKVSAFIVQCVIFRQRILFENDFTICSPLNPLALKHFKLFTRRLYDVNKIFLIKLP